VFILYDLHNISVYYCDHTVVDNAYNILCGLKINVIQWHPKVHDYLVASVV